MEETQLSDMDLGAAVDDGPSAAESHNRVLRLEGSADVNAELAEIGLSNKSGWYASIVLYGVGGLVTVAAGLLRPEVVPMGVTYLGCMAVLLSLLSIVGARFLTNADWATHARLIAGLLIFLVGAFVAGDLRIAFVMMPLFVLITPTFLYGARFALPYVCVVTPALLLVVLLTPGAGHVAHAIISAGTILAITSSFMAAEHRTRALARANRRMAYSDPLTGIANTRRLRETLAAALGAPTIEEKPFALFAIDLDNFKQVNDTFDHTTGDKVLRAVAQALAAEAGEDDLVARRGGDEFSVLIAHPAGIDLERLTLRLSRAIERARLATCPQVTPSGSVAYVFSETDDSISSVLQRADDALHESKLAFRAGERPMLAADDADPAERDRRVRAAGREAALRSVSAAVSRAYSKPGSSRGKKQFDFWRATVFRHVARLDLLWTYVGATALPMGAAIMVLTAVGALSPLPLGIGLAAGGVIVGLGIFSLHAARVGVRKAWIFWTMLGLIGALSIAVAFAAETGTALLDIYVVLALFGFYFLRTREALFTMALSSALFVGFAFSSDSPYAGIRSAVTVSVILAATAIVIKVRSVTLGFVRKNRELSEVDELTGVPNLRALKLRIESAIEEQSKSDVKGVPMIMTVDLDRFKLVNDRYNHTTGDKVLEAAARAISESVRIDEMVARRGGDEFFVLFSRSNPGHLEAAIPRVEAAVSHARERICPDLTPTATVGWVEWREG
ncbi:MAG: GGDEF domain-containing protein [Solirubrobacterales bacterium]